MSKRWSIIEKIIASIQILFGLFWICLTFYMIDKHLEIVYRMGYEWNDISIWKISHHYYDFLLKSLFAIVSGVLLIRGKLSGWLLSEVTWWSFGIAIFRVFFTSTNDDRDAIPKIFFITLFTIIFLFNLILISKPFLYKYRPTIKNWLTIIAVIFLIEIIRILTRMEF